MPVLRRPQRAAPFMHSLRETAGPAVCRVTVIAGLDDVHTAIAWAQCGANVTFCDAEPGSFAQRVNYGYRRTRREWMLLVGDDVHFHHQWWQRALAEAERSGANVIGTNDLGNGAVMAGQHATHMLIRRSYVDEVGAGWDGPGVVCHEGYRHCFVDDEIVTAAKDRGTFLPVLTSVIEHLHPAWGKSEIDETYAIGAESMGADRLTYERRRASR